MTSTILPIVGMQFRPPAAKLLAELPFDTELLLQRQYDNQYDENAVKVLLPGFSPEGVHKELFARYWNEALPDEFPAGRGLWNQSQLTDPLWLGFIGSKTGHAKVLAEILDPKMDDEVPRYLENPPMLLGKLTALATGGPAVIIECTEDQLARFNAL